MIPKDCRRGRGLCGFALLLAIACCGAGAVRSAAASGGALDRRAPVWQVLAADASHLVLRVAAEPRWQASADGCGELACHGFLGRALVGEGTVPALALPVGLPPEGPFRVSVALHEEVPLGTGCAALGPAAESGPSADAERAAEAVWKPLGAGGYVEHQAARWHGDLRVLPLRVRAARTDAAGRLWAVRSLTVTIAFPAGETGGVGTKSGAPAGASTQRLARARATAPGIMRLVNAEQAAGWRRSAPVQPIRRGDGFSTATSSWLRLSVPRRGLYRVTVDDLLAAGVAPGAVDLAQLRLFAGPAGVLPESLDVEALPEWMEPVALLLEDDGDGQWDAATRLYFLANGPDGWRADLGQEEPEPDDRYFRHPYARSFHYWLCWGGAFATPPLWMETVDADPGTLPVAESATGRVHVEDELIYSPRPREEGLDWPRFFHRGLRASSDEPGASVAAALPGLVAGATGTVRVGLWGGSWNVPGTDNDHHARVLLNGGELADLWWERLDRRIVVAAEQPLATSNQISFYVPYRSGVIDIVYLDWVEIDYPRALDASQDSLAFFVSAASAAETGWRIRGLRTTQDWLLLDASDPHRPRVLEPRLAEDGEQVVAEFRVTPLGADAHLVFLQRGLAAAPAEVVQVAPAEGWLRERTAAIDYLIVTVPELRAAADALAAHRSAYFYGANGDSVMAGRVAIVTSQEIFDEFAWGQHDPVALRNAIAFLRRAWRGSEEAATLSHVLLLGNAHYDPRGHLGGSQADLVPGYAAYNWRYQYVESWSPDYFGDDWFTLLDGPGDAGPDLAIGRLPAETGQQAWNMVRKVIDTETDAPRGSWRTRLLFAADDICQGSSIDPIDFDHMRQTEALVGAAAPANAKLEKLYLYEYGSECRYDRKPQATSDLLATLAEGALLFNFVGHGSEVQLADERLLDQSSIASLSNHFKPFLMITASCAVGNFAEGGDGLAVQALRLAERGALGVLSASATASSGENADLNGYFLEGLFPSGDLLQDRAHGTALLAAKLANASENDRRYNLLGDPGARLRVPAARLELWLEEVPGVAAGADTLIRGAAARLRGRVVDLGGQPLGAFDGEAEIEVFDSDILRSPTPGEPVNDYLLPGARIFSGTVAVSAGEIDCRFFVPTALRTGARGAAHLHVYAEEAGGSGDAAGALPNLFIPEEREPSAGDTLGPVIALSWERPEELPAAGSWLRATLVDSSGIYVAALAPSRSVVLTVRDREERPVLAEDLAPLVTFGSDYRTAALRWALPDGLPTGEPLTLALEASDNLGRRSGATLEFQVGAGSGAPASLLGRVYAIPNPMEKATRFLLELEREADAELTIYTVSGRKLRTLKPGTLSPARAREAGIFWDGRDGDGDRVANGLYFFHLRVRDGAGAAAERTERLVVMR